MSYTFIENQPIFFTRDAFPEWLPGEGEPFGWKMKIQAGDEHFVQIKVAPYAFELELFQSPDIGDVSKWGVTGSAVVTSGLVTIGNGSSGSAFPDLTGDPFPPSPSYAQLVVEVKTLFGHVHVLSGVNEIGQLTATGTQTLSFTYSGDISFVVDDSNSYIEFTNASLKKLPSIFIIAAIDGTGSSAPLGTPIAIMSSELYPTNFILKNDRLTIHLPFTGLSPFAGLPTGCYWFAIADPEENNCTEFGLYNPDFSLGNSDESGVTSIPGWQNMQPFSGTALFKPGPFSVEIPASDTFVTQGIQPTYFNNFCAGKQYKFEIQAEPGPGADSPIVQVRIGSDEVGSNVTAVGLYTLYITPSSSGAVEIFNGNYGSDSTLIIYSITVTLVNVVDYVFPYNTSLQTLGEDNNFQFDYESEYPDTFLIQLFNNEDGLGFVFEGSNFIPSLRIEADIFNRSYEYERDAETSDNGIEFVTFGERRKYKTIRTEKLPNFIHDFLSLGPIVDYFYISLGTQTKVFFLKNDAYEPEYQDVLDNYAPVVLEIGDPVQFIRNTNSGLIQNIY